jgi:integrase
VNLTAKAVAGLDLPPGKDDAIFFDDDVTGFGVRLRRSADGSINRTWIAQYRHQGATRRLRIGNSTVSAEMARKAAKNALAAAQLGGDPQGAKTEQRDKDQRQFRTVVAEYLQAKQPKVKPKTYRDVERYLIGPYFKPLHTKGIDAVTRADVSLSLTRIERDCGSTTAVRARTTLSAFYSWCMSMGLAESNPVIGAIKPQDSKSRERVLTDAELVEVWEAADDDAFGRIVKLLILTGQRRTEVGGMRWDELDEVKGTWTIPATRTKNERTHTITLPPMAWDTINVKNKDFRAGFGDFLFGIRAGFGHWGLKQDLDGMLKGVAPWTLHDLRRTMATRMGDIGVQPHIIEAALNHQSGAKKGTAGIYNRSSYTHEVKAALALWADHVRALVDGDGRKILPFQAAAS